MQGQHIGWVLGSVWSLPCFAHHGVAPHYDATKPVHVEGVIAKFDFINPHSFFMDSRRIMHLNAAAPADAPRGTMGYSTGRFEGDALVVSTDHFAAGTIEPRRGIMHTENLKLTEPLEVNDLGELEITMTIDDPAFFTEPFTLKELFVRSRLDPEPYNCKPGYQQ